MAKAKEVLFKGHRCLEFSDGTIVGQGKMRAVLDNAVECRDWLNSTTKPIDNSLMSLVEALRKAGYKVSK